MPKADFFFTHSLQLTLVGKINDNKMHCNKNIIIKIRVFIMYIRDRANSERRACHGVA